MKKGRIFSGKIKAVLVMPEGKLIGLPKEPKKIPGGYLDHNGHRYIRCGKKPFNQIRCIPNLYNCI